MEWKLANTMSTPQGKCDAVTSSGILAVQINHMNKNGNQLTVCKTAPIKDGAYELASVRDIVLVDVEKLLDKKYDR
jgi:hypothetical protein